MRWYKRKSAVCILPCLHGHAQAHATVRSRESDRIRCVIKWGPRPAHVQQNNWKVWKTRIHLCQFSENNKKKVYISKKIIQLPLDCLWTPTWPPFNVFWNTLIAASASVWKRSIKQWSLYLFSDHAFAFRNCYSPTCCFSSSTLVIKSFTLFRVPETWRENHWKTYAMLYNFRIVFAVKNCSVRPPIK